MDDPIYFVIVREADTQLFHVIETRNSSEASYKVNKIIANGIQLDDIDVVVGFRTEITAGMRDSTVN